jgi:two-component system, NtrC family, sensor histidine kinase KinB
MKTSALIKTSVGVMVFFFFILLIGIAKYLNDLSNKTTAILKENHNSVVYARDMSNSLKTLNQEMVIGFLSDAKPDISIVSNEIIQFDKSLKYEENNITEPGEDKIVSAIEKDYYEFRDSLKLFAKSKYSVDKILYLQKKFDSIYKQLVVLSQLNESAIEFKTEDAKISAKNALIQMGILGAICIILALIFAFGLSYYFNQRFYKLYDGIKEIAASDYVQRLHFDAKDEYYEISLVFNEMAEKLSDKNQKIALNLNDNSKKEQSAEDIQELKRVLKLIKSVEEKAYKLISKIEADE